MASRLSEGKLFSFHFNKGRARKVDRTPKKYVVKIARRTNSERKGGEILASHSIPDLSSFLTHISTAPCSHAGCPPAQSSQSLFGPEMEGSRVSRWLLSRRILTHLRLSSKPSPQRVQAFCPPLPSTQTPDTGGYIGAGTGSLGRFNFFHLEPAGLQPGSPGREGGRERRTRIF